MIKYLSSNTSCLLRVRLYVSVLTSSSSGLFANQVSRCWLHDGIPSPSLGIFTDQTQRNIQEDLNLMVTKLEYYKRWGNPLQEQWISTAQGLFYMDSVNESYWIIHRELFLLQNL